MRNVALMFGRVVLVILALVVWELGSGTIFPEIMVSRPTRVGPVLWQWIVDGSLLRHGLETLRVAAIALVIGSIVAVITGVALGRIRVLGQLLEPFLSALYSVPRVALVPLFIMWFGIGFEMRILFAAMLVFFLMFFAIYAGVREVDSNYIDAVRIMGMGQWGIARYVVMPSTVVWIIHGFKTSIPYSLVGTVVAEMFAGNSGLGYLLASQAAVFNAAGVFASLAVLVVVGYGTNSLAQFIGTRALRWQDR